ncbi:hypothetical protein CCAX7_27800 [Capsulimonas corticalis]|uniref:Bacterial Pleckstrin homology domain-containing protein n=1 Tax=Capsulimonas corticalis TaxID=2219043 RepID=A0A402CTJ0_9BACT|nr:PH domain-containing protein [Capsulimonas corticalis]BDI30729.1 hypothetical protein CCAX7_27800 [Capsulimonas corticalis]
MQRVFPMAAPRAMAANVLRGVVVFTAIMSVISVATVPASGRWIVALVWIPTFGLLFRVASRMGKVTFEVEGGALQIHGDLFRRNIPLSNLRLSEARHLDLSGEPALAPVIRLGGTALPGYQSGWYRLRNGEKAFVYLTDYTKAIHLPTTLGYSLLLSPDDPQAFLDAVRGAH